MDTAGLLPGPGRLVGKLERVCVCVCVYIYVCVCVCIHSPIYLIVVLLIKLGYSFRLLIARFNYVD